MKKKSFKILLSASNCSKNAFRDSRTSVKMRVKVDELKSLKSIGYYYSIISPFLSYFFKNLYVYGYGVSGLPPWFKYEKNYWLKKMQLKT